MNCVLETIKRLKDKEQSVADFTAKARRWDVFNGLAGHF